MTSLDETPPPPAPAGRRKRPTHLRRRLLIGGGVVVLVLALIAGAAVWKLQSNIDTAPLLKRSASAKDTTPPGATNILFLGSDSRDLKDKDSEYGKGNGSRRSDSMLLVHIAAKNARIDAVQVPRDTVMELPSCPAIKGSGGKFAGGCGQVNSALNWGPGCSVRTIEKLTKVSIQHFVVLDFEGFASMVNALGGVPVCLDTALVDKDAKLDLPAGKQTLKGKAALALARTRHAIGDGSDIGRLGHQQMVMSAIVDRARSAGVLTRPDRLFRFLNALTSSITVDSGISSIKALSGLAKRAQSVPNKKITFITMPTGAAPEDPNRVVPTDAAQTVFSSLAKDQPVPLKGSDDAKDDGVRTSTVRILNAARTPGLATSAQTTLTKLGYTVSGLADAQQPAETTRMFVGSSDADRKTAETINSDLGLKATIVQRDIDGVWLVLGKDRITAGTDAVKPEPVEATSRTAAASLCS